MEKLSLILQLAGMAILFLGIPVGISLLIYRVIKKQKIDKRWMFLALLPLLYMGFGIYGGIFNPNGLYKKHFKEVTGLEFPENAEFVDTKSWSWGPYSREAVTLSLVKTDTTFYDNLPSALEKHGLSETHSDFSQDLLEFHEVLYMLKDYDGLEPVKDYALKKNGRIYCHLVFLSDGVSMIVYAWHD